VIFYSWSYLLLNISKTKPIILSLSFGFDSAINRARAVSHPGVIASLKSKSALLKNQIKLNAHVLLFPSVNG